MTLVGTNEAVHDRTLQKDNIMIVVTIVMVIAVVMITMHLFILMLNYADTAQ